MRMTRRDFLLGGTMFGLTTGCAVSAKRGLAYSVAVLGDIHFDSPDKKFYHADYTHSTTVKRYKAHCAEHVRNAEMWTARMPSLVRASAACLKDDTAFAFQMGDLVQGDCGKAATHRKMLDDAFGFLKKTYGGQLPIAVVTGNHDIRGDVKGDGARETMDDWMTRGVEQEFGVRETGGTFLLRHGPDVYLVVDFNEPSPDLALLKKLLAESEGARYTFIVSHGPVIPNGESMWFLYGRGEKTEERRELRALLARRNAIALSGHTHLLEYYDCAFPEGRITQFVFNSVWAKPEWAEAEFSADGAVDYGMFKGKGKRHGVARSEELQRLVDEYKPFVRDALCVCTAGHYRLEVSDERVAVVFYNGDATKPIRTFMLRGNT
ncbi:MAG: metallophosphoesterase [Kiritimatiellae bacterium]|nr:metallophosphoesterase [Kiritimatiellia bacterium]